MTYYGSLFFNFPALKDVMVIVIDNEKIPSKVVVSGDCVGLYCGEELVGVNIFNSSKYLTLRLSGLFHNPNEPLIELVNSLINQALKEDVVLAQSKIVLGKITKVLEGGFLVIGENETEKNASSLDTESLKEGDYVLLAPPHTRLDNGDISDRFMKKSDSYLIVGEEEEPDDDSALGQDAYSLEKKR
jgi:hypothetical protein